KGGGQTRLAALQRGGDVGSGQGDEVQNDFGALGSGIGADRALFLGRALAGQRTDGLGALQGLDDPQHARSVVVLTARRGNPHRIVVAGGSQRSQGADGGDQKGARRHGRASLVLSASCALRGRNPV